jgi:hypothetical protein
LATSWHFFAVRAHTASGFTWQWQKQGATVPVTSSPFDFYFDCVSNARENGYDGPLPAGPKAPLQRLPIAPTKTGRVSAPLPPSASNVVMTVTEVSADDVKRRATDRRSRVT